METITKNDPSEVRHTPGPWEIVRDPVLRTRVWPVCEMFQGGAVQEANARLIAAAPEMFLLLKAFVNSASWNHRDGCWNIGPLADCEGGKMSCAREIIAKVEGR